MRRSHGESTLRIGFKDREPTYLNTLANSLLLNPWQCDKDKIKEIDNKLQSFTSNIDMADYLFNLSILAYQNEKINYSLAEAYYGLAQVCWLKGEVIQAREHIARCIAVQQEMKRSVHHVEMKKAQLLQNQLAQPLTTEEVFEQQHKISM